MKRENTKTFILIAVIVLQFLIFFLILASSTTGDGKKTIWKEHVRKGVIIPVVNLRQYGKNVIVHLWDDSMMSRDWYWYEGVRY